MSAEREGNAPLDDYLEKRDFSSTPEPAGDATAPSTSDPVFVIHEHQASNHHFDLRLQVGDALRSWAIPKGPSTDPADKRLAVPTEDHPLAYADFEGVIPEGEYGAGAVIVWDAGPYTILKSDEEGNPVPLEEQLEDGHATFELHGEKLQGGYALTRLDDDDRWLLVKMDDQGADARRRPTSTEPESVLSGRTVEEMEREGGGQEEGS